MKRRARVLMPVAVLTIASGCVSQSWVDRELDRRDARLEQTLSGARGATAQARQEADRVEQQLGAVDQRVRALESRTAELDARSSQVETRSSQLEARGSQLEARTSRLDARLQDVSTRAAEAGARAEGTDARLSRLWSTRNARTVVNSLPVVFGFDQSSLDDAAKSMLFALVRELRDNPELALDLEGFTDSRGSYEYNVRLSQRRIDAVRRYLIEQGVERHRIRASARGPVADPSVPEDRRRRVDIKLVVVIAAD